MSPAPLLVVVAAALTGATLLALPSVPTHPSPAGASVGVAAGQAPAAGSGALRAAGIGPVTPPRTIGPLAPAGAVSPARGDTGGRSPVARFRWPLSPAPAVLRRFVVGPQPWSPGHRGVDLTGRPGEAVLSAGAGTVVFAGMVAGRGVVTVMHPGGIRTTYEPVTAEVRAGQEVAAGATLGVLAARDHCPVACLHWGALRGETYLDPLSLLRPVVPPILLPMGGA